MDERLSKIKAPFYFCMRCEISCPLNGLSGGGSGEGEQAVASGLRFTEYFFYLQFRQAAWVSIWLRVRTGSGRVFFSSTKFQLSSGHRRWFNCTIITKIIFNVPLLLVIIDGSDGTREPNPRWRADLLFSFAHIIKLLSNLRIRVIKFIGSWIPGLN